jgi:hypothetical protein
MGDPRRTSRCIPSYPSYPRQNFFFSPMRTECERLALAARGAPRDPLIFGRRLTGKILSVQAERGIMVRGNGVGAAIASNKIRGSRAARLAPSASDSRA